MIDKKENGKAEAIRKVHDKINKEKEKKQLKTLITAGT